MRPMPDQIQIVNIRDSVYEFQPFGRDSCMAEEHGDAVEKLRTSDGIMEICKRCSAVRFVPHEEVRS